ncbi:hypothetical protein [Clostridium sp. YIM B02506]|nr:hypothetical protein [Clostridium sp. YIM B02506]
MLLIVINLCYILQDILYIIGISKKEKDNLVGFEYGNESMNAEEVMGYLIYQWEKT